MSSASPVRSRHHLTPDQVAAFDRDGYLILRDRIPSGLLARLRDASDRWIADGRRSGGPDHVYADGPDGPRLWRIDYLHALGDPASLALLGSPEVLGIAESLAGPDLVPTYESLVFKDEAAGAPVAWHQDAVHVRRHRTFNVDVYLDASRADSGALRVVRGSQKAAVDVCAIADDHGWTPPGSVEVELEPGDVLVHDVMVVHGSPPTGVGAARRRTLYLEFRSAHQILEEGPWDRAWIDARPRLLPLALRAHAEVTGSTEPFAWRPDPALRPTPIGDDVVELRVAHGAHSPGSWCSPGGVLTR